jgi:hypothetical protein
MQAIVSTTMQAFRKSFLPIAFVCLFNLIGWFGFFVGPSYAVSNTKEALMDIRKDMATQDPQKVYEEATEADRKPKIAEQKKYEKNVNEYYEEHPEEGGLLQEAKELVNTVTSNE